MTWSPTKSDLKTYRHFDAVIGLADIPLLYSSPEKVSKHTFYPFLHYEKQWRRAPVKVDGKLVKREPKKREIRYACRADSYIFKYYRSILSERYETVLSDLGLSSSVLAYRQIPEPTGTGHKSNIEFADDAFKSIEKLGHSCAVAMDISNFFGSVSHSKIKQDWKSLLNEPELPDDHYSVFKALTNFSYVDINEAYAALGYSKRNADDSYSYLVDPKSVPRKICTAKEYKSQIVGNGLVRKNPGAFGIPQGAPLSDLIANLYLLGFDVAMRKYAKSKGGYYYRYSDDVLLILPGDGRAARAAFRFDVKHIQTTGEKIKIKPEKTEITCFTGSGTLRCYNLQFQSGKLVRTSPNDGFSYLGFRYDGRFVYLRSSTISNLQGKIFRNTRALAMNHVDRHRDKNLKWLLENAPHKELAERFFQARDFDRHWAEAIEAGTLPYDRMTFYSYGKRAVKRFRQRGKPIQKQLKRIRASISNRFEAQIVAKYQTRLGRYTAKT